MKDKKYTYTLIVKQIREMIRKGELRAGSKLPPERFLAKLFGVSRNSLRQALQALAERKIIESRQGDGTYLLESFDAVFANDVIFEALSEKDSYLRDIVEFRQLIEPQIAALAAKKIQAVALDRLKILVCDQQRALMSGKEDDSYDIEFHRLLTECAGNQVLMQMMTSVQSVVNQSRSVWLQSKERRDASVEGHLRIIDALERKDENAAFSAMKEHLAEVEGYVLGDSN